MDRTEVCNICKKPIIYGLPHVGHSPPFRMIQGKRRPVRHTLRCTVNGCTFSARMRSTMKHHLETRHLETKHPMGLHITPPVSPLREKCPYCPEPQYIPVSIINKHIQREHECPWCPGPIYFPDINKHIQHAHDDEHESELRLGDGVTCWTGFGDGVSCRTGYRNPAPPSPHHYPTYSQPYRKAELDKQLRELGNQLEQIALEPKGGKRKTNYKSKSRCRTKRKTQRRK